jgi:hypothetical protein
MSHNPRWYQKANPVGGKSWSDEDDQTRLAMVREGVPYKDIAAKLNRTIAAVKSRVRYTGMTIEERAATRRARLKNEQPVIRMKIDHVTERAPSIPDEVWDDRNRRLMAQRSLTAMLCGDPEPGRVRL